MKLTYLFLFAFSTLLLGYFSFSMLDHPTGNVVSSLYQDYVSLTMQPDHGLSTGSGSEILDLPRSVTSCTFSGTWRTNNNQAFNLRRFCHRATGTFSGYADASEQYVINDPDIFRWAGISRAAMNPPVATHQGYSFWMETCDDDYYSLRHIPRYTAKGTITGFGTDTLAFIWDYYDENNSPVVDFSFTLTCQTR